VPCTGPVSGDTQRNRQKTSRLAALCDASDQLQSRLRNEIFRSDFVDQGSNSLLQVSVSSFVDF